MIAAACLTLGMMHLLVWCRQRDAVGSLLFSISAAAVAAMAASELWIMLARTADEYGTALRWGHVSVWVMMVFMVWFVRVYLRAGRAWLAWTVCVLRTIALAVNFIVSPNINYREITGIRHIPFLGDQIAIAEGIPNPWMLVGQVSLLLMILFTADAAWTVWRRGNRGPAIRVAGSMAVFLFLGAGHSALVFWGVIQAPLTPSLFYLGTIAGMAYELSDEVLRAAKVSRDLLESERRIELASDAAGLGLWVWDFGSNLIWATPRCRAFFGFGPQEPITYPDFLARVHPDDRDTTAEAISASIHGGRYEGEYRLAQTSAEERWISATGRVECNDAGFPRRMHGVCREITDRRRSQQEAALLRREVAHVGRVSMMGQLASALAHELNQPLGAILRNAEAAELFLMEPTPDLVEIRAIVADILKDDRRAGAVIDRMRSLMKREEIESRPIDTGDLLEEVARLVRGDAMARRIKLELDVDAGVPQVVGDRVHIQQVLLNLILNGMDSINGNMDGERKVSLRAGAQGDGVVGITVKDSGQGISEEKLAGVFEPFYTTKSNGMGMGLPISRTIIEAHGGKLWAENNPEGGASFHFTLNALRSGNK